MKFDPANKTLEISVRELAEDDGFRRIGFAQADGWGRLGLGAELHARVLQARRAADPKYRAEVFLQSEIPCGDWRVTVTGRLDGCIQRADGRWLIEEFKSSFVSSDETRRSGPAFDEHRRQLLIYCHLWQRLGNGPVSGALVYVDIATGKELTIEVAYDETVAEKEFQLRLQRVLALWAAEETLRAEKAEAAATLPFPHAAPRPGQQQIIEAVRIVAQQNENLIAEAPTGSGKTAAGLHPALAESLRTGRQLVFLTSKTLQQKMAVGALTAMNQSGAFRTLQLRAKEKLCANDRVICHEDFCPYAKNYPEKMATSRILDRLRADHRHFDPDTIFAEAKRERVCPFEVQLELAARADAVVADYNYVFDPGVALRHLGRDELEKVMLLVDEAHNLPDRARKIFSPELLEEQFEAARAWVRSLRGKKLRSKKSRAAVPQDLWEFGTRQATGNAESSQGRTGGPPVPGEGAAPLSRTGEPPVLRFAESNLPRDTADAMEETFDGVIALLRECAEKLFATRRDEDGAPEDFGERRARSDAPYQSPAPQAIAEMEPPAEALKELWRTWEPRFLRYLSWKRESKVALTDDPVVDLHFSLQRFLATLSIFGPGFSCVIERRPAGIRLAIVCLDPARPLAPIFRAAASTVFLSATLSPVPVIERTLGLEKNRTASISLPPPFPKENRKILILPQVRTTFAARERNFPRIAQLIAQMSDALGMPAQSASALERGCVGVRDQPQRVALPGRSQIAGVDFVPPAAAGAPTPAHSRAPMNALVLFPSYTFLEKVAERMPPTRARLLLQRANFSDAEREQILQTLAAPPAEGVLLFAVLGGMYAEGVDYPGELLSAVFVVSPGLPQLSFERELLRRYFDEKEGAGFEYAYLQPGMTRVVQAAGRLIRSERDRGIIALLCQRFLQDPYASHLPRDWYDETPAELIAQDPARAIQEFIGATPRAEHG